MSTTNASENVEQPKYYLNYESILPKNLHKMLSIEYILALVVMINLGISIWIFNTTSFEGIVVLPGIVQVYLEIWNSGIKICYNLVWGQVLICIFALFLRKQFQKLSVIPKIIQLDQGTKINIQKNMSQEYNSHSESKEIATALRDLRLYYIICFVCIGILIGYLNYFPRGADLFPSIVQVSLNVWVIQAPAEYTSFFWINTVWCVISAMTFFFLIMFSLRQIKDMRYIIKQQKILELERKTIPENSEKTTANSTDSWKPPLSKPWDKMTITEHKEYQMKVIQLEKERARIKQQQRFQQLVNEERERRRLGDEFFEKKQKEKKQEEILLKKQQKKVSEPDAKFDFR